MTEGTSLLELVGAREAALKAEAKAADRVAKARAAYDAATAELVAAELAQDEAYEAAVVANLAVTRAEQTAKNGGIIRLI